MIKKTLLLILSIIILSATVSAIDHYYEIQLKYSYGDISHDPIKVKPLTAETKLENLPGGYVAEIVSFDDEVLNLTFFDFPLEILYDNFDEETGYAVSGGLIELNETDITLKLPYYEDAKDIIIYDEEIEEKLTIDVSPYAKEVPTGFKVEIPEELEEEKLPKEEIERKPMDYTLFLLIAFIAVVLIAVFLVKRKKK